jgi:hypothetical protein
MKWKASCLAVLVCTSWSLAVYAQEPRATQATADEDDHAIVFELGAAGDWERGEAIHKGVTLAFEVTPIEHWLELEIGATALAADGGVEVPFDVLFKKPWQPSPRFEFMVGVGPEVVHVSGRDGGTFWGAEGVLDFMFWPRKNVGWYVEPGYEIVWRDGTRHHGIGMAVGLLIGR